MSDHDLDLSIIIVTFNSLPAIVGCLNSLGADPKSISSEVVIVDNRSTDGTIAEVVNHRIRPHIISLPSNLGFAGACNRGAQRARGEFLLFLNPDVEVDHGAIRELTAFCRSHPEAGLVTGRLRHPDGSFQPNCRRFPSRTNMILSRGSSLSRFLGRSTGYTLLDSDKPVVVEAVAGTMLAVSRVRFSELGGFDDRFFMYMEDTDLSLRAVKAGYQNYFVPNAGAMHQWAKGSKAGRLIRLFYHHRSVWKYFVKHFPGILSMIMLPPMLCLNFFLAAVLGTRQRGKS